MRILLLYLKWMNYIPSVLLFATFSKADDDSEDKKEPHHAPQCDHHDFHYTGE